MTKKKRKRRHLRKEIKVFLTVLALIIASTVLVKVSTGKKKGNETAAAASETTAASASEGPQTYTANLFIAGDNLIHSTICYYAQKEDGSFDFSPIVENLGSLSEGYDLKYYNQETCLGGAELGLTDFPQFNTPQEAGDAMVNLGFNLVSTANNHALDRGDQQFANSQAYWKKQAEENQVHMAGTYSSWEKQQAIPVYEVNGITYTFFSWTYGTNGILPPEGKEYEVNVYPGREEEMLAQIRQADEISDVVIVAMHWGIEYQFNFNAEQQTLAQQLADAGADIIIGNHPHVIEPVAHVGNAVCFYAMGNMLSAQEDISNRISMVGGITIHKTVDGDTTTVTLDNVRADLIYTYDTSDYSNFKIYAFDQLDDSILPDYQKIYSQYSAIITQADSSIQVGGIRLN
jgi:poly-gamma-glutamate synthesis protein (capsule biosynthesis protein)